MSRIPSIVLVKLKWRWLGFVHLDPSDIVQLPHVLYMCLSPECRCLLGRQLHSCMIRCRSHTARNEYEPVVNNKTWLIASNFLLRVTNTTKHPSDCLHNLLDCARMFHLTLLFYVAEPFSDRYFPESDSYPIHHAETTNCFITQWLTCVLFIPHTICTKL